MEKTFTVKQIGIIRTGAEDAKIILDRAFAPALAGLDGFSHLNLLWWFSECDDNASRNALQEKTPYKKAPAVLGTFATRSPRRPNPLALFCVEICYIDMENAVIGITYTDAADGSPVLDIKPYTPSLDRVGSPEVPAWCAHWPQSMEDSGSFDWAQEFNF
ncbi:MAG: SAM-dependent methyltransferase [Christensenellaceae bacterium]|jgi:tRNA-Thr(GGU) m(6)t(6)A37 methyltransferase TsaA